MLNYRKALSHWRPAKVAAWIIGLCKRIELEDELIETLDKSNGYCEHLIFALALLNTENSIAGIERYIQAKANAQREKKMSVILIGNRFLYPLLV